MIPKVQTKVVSTNTNSAIDASMVAMKIDDSSANNIDNSCFKSVYVQSVNVTKNYIDKACQTDPYPVDAKDLVFNRVRVSEPVTVYTSNLPADYEFLEETTIKPPNKNVSACKKIKVELLDKRIGTVIPLPSISSSSVGSMDVGVCIDAIVELGPGKSCLLPTNLAFHIEDPTIVAIVLPHPLLTQAPDFTLNVSIGFISSSYNGALTIRCKNEGEKNIFVHPGDCIAQLHFVSLIPFSIELINGYSIPEIIGSKVELADSNSSTSVEETDYEII